MMAAKKDSSDDESTKKDKDQAEQPPTQESQPPSSADVGSAEKESEPVPSQKASSSKHGPAKDGSAQPPPPELNEHGETVPWSPEHPHGHQSLEAEEAIYTQLVEVRKIVAQLLQDAQQAKIRKRLELVPVRVSDLMQGFQSAVAKANRATRAGEDNGEDIELMAIKDLEVSIMAPIIDSAHAEDPVLMLPNIKSVDAESPSVTLKFSVVSVPRQKRG